MNKLSAGLTVLAVLVVGGLALFARFTDLPTVYETPSVTSPADTGTPAPATSAQPPAENPESGQGGAPGGEGRQSDDVDTYRAMLRELDVKGRAPMTGYDRDLFGQAWSDDVAVEFGRNGCDTRNDILRRDLVDPVIREGTHGCLVESGTLHGPYTGKTIDFERGDGSVEIDHVVALADAWAKGAQQLDEDTRRNFANDPRNLRAVDAGANRQKGAGDAATWQPANNAYRCDYARAQIEVKHAYDLWVTGAEYEALDRELNRC